MTRVAREGVLYGRTSTRIAGSAIRVGKTGLLDVAYAVRESNEGCKLDSHNQDVLWYSRSIRLGINIWRAHKQCLQYKMCMSGGKSVEESGTRHVSGRDKPAPVQCPIITARADTVYESSK